MEPATSSSGVGSIWGRFAPFIFRACSTGQPTSCHELRSLESGDSIPRRSSWFATFWTRTGRPVSTVWTGGFPDNPEAPARLCAQGSHYSIQGPGGEPASAAPGGGRPSPGFALSRPSIETLRWLDAKLQDLRPALVCHGGRQKGNTISKQRMAHWIVDAITLAYQAQCVPCLFRLRAHSTRSVASSWALARGASLTDICRAAGWATPNTFTRFYSLRVEPVSSCVLTSNG